MKKVFVLLMCAVMLLSFTACLATPEPIESAKDETTTPKPEKELPVSGVEGAYKFDEYSDHIVLTEYIGKGGSPYIPDEIKGKPVTEFGTIFRGNLAIKGLQIGKYCTRIDDNAFENCYNLQRLEIVSGVTSIGERAFFGCHSLRLIFIPGCVEKIAENAFLYCTDLIIYGDKGSTAESFADVYESVYFREKTPEAEAELTTVLISETYTEETL